MPVRDERPRRERRDRELHPVHHGIQPPLQQLDQQLRGVAAHPHGLLVVAAELLLADVAVVAAQLLLRRQLRAVVRGLLAALAMLARPVLTLVDRGFRPSPEVHPQATIDLVFTLGALGHRRVALSFGSVAPVGHPKVAGAGPEVPSTFPAVGAAYRGRWLAVSNPRINRSLKLDTGKLINIQMI